MERDFVREKELNIIHKLGYENEIDLDLPVRALREKRILKEYSKLPLYSSFAANINDKKEDYTYEQKKAIIDADGDGIPAKFIMFKKYSPARINAIHTKLVHDEDCKYLLDFTLEDSVAFLVSEATTPSQVKLLENLSSYTYDQLLRIIEAVDNKLDYCTLLDPNMSHENMQHMLDLMMDDKYSVGSNKRKLNILNDMKHKLSNEQMEVLLSGIDQVDKMALYANPDYSPRLMDLLMFRRDNYRLEDETNFDAHHVYEQVISDIFCGSVVNRVDYDLSFERIYCLEFEYFTKLDLGVSEMSDGEVKRLYLDLFKNGVNAKPAKEVLKNLVTKMELI